MYCRMNMSCELGLGVIVWDTSLYISYMYMHIRVRRATSNKFTLYTVTVILSLSRLQYVFHLT